MPHISSKKLDSILMQKLFGKLLTLLDKAHDKKSTSKILNELFTETENIMFAKRLAIILMLSSKTPQHRIVEVLQVSPSTVAKTSLLIEIGKYEAVLKVSTKEKISLEKIVWSILTAGGVMPPRLGRKYWTKHFK